MISAPCRKQTIRTTRGGSGSDWETKLTRVGETWDGDRFETLHQTRDFVLAQDVDMNEWTNAAGKLMRAAEIGSHEDVAARDRSAGTCAVPRDAVEALRECGALLIVRGHCVQ